jgi:hypothetical protein
MLISNQLVIARVGNSMSVLSESGVPETTRDLSRRWLLECLPTRHSILMRALKRWHCFVVCNTLCRVQR